MKVDQILQSKGVDVFSVSADATVAEAIAALNEKNIGAVLVTDGGGKLVGIFSERDVVRRVGKVGGDALQMKIAECMTPDPITIDPSADVDSVMAKMTERRIRHLPVMDGANVVGVVSIGDVVKRKIEQAEQEAAALKEYIAS